MEARMKTGNFPGRKQLRRKGALDRLLNKRDKSKTDLKEIEVLKQKLQSGFDKVFTKKDRSARGKRQ
jgi:hypothetical protein